MQGVWFGVDGAQRRIKSGPLWEAFHGLRHKERDLGSSPVDLARAYSAAVWAYRCIKLRSDALAGVPLRLVDSTGAPIRQHPLLRLLHDVNPQTMNLGDLLRATESAYNIFGVAYWLMDGPRRPQRLYWLNPQTIEPVSDSQRGIVAYKQTVGGKTRELPPDRVIVFRNFDPLDDLGGLSPLSVVLNEINAERRAGEYVAAFFANDARPAGLLTTDQPLVDSEMSRIQTWWQRLFSGARNRWKTGIVGGGLRWQAISYPPTDLALPDLRDENRRAICAAFGVPPGVAGAWEAVTYATAREQKASFYEDTMLPQMEYMAEVLTWSLLPRFPDLTGAKLTWDFDSITALRESAQSRTERLTALFRAGLITRNEARAELGFQPSEEDGFVFDITQEADETDDPQAAAKALHADLARYERFALNRIRQGRDLRRFRSGVIPDHLLDDIHEALQEATTPDQVAALFDAVRDSQAAA